MYCLLACHNCMMRYKGSNDSLHRVTIPSTACACCMRTHPLTALRMLHAGWVDNAHHSGNLPAAIDV